ncbi:MAG: hypothetical protein U9O94_07580, partial [Nanoarchaeota archaeon]|nr:hypothetical protein [Nanoarchaeota archaeon]
MKTKFEVLKAILVLGILIGLAKAAIAAPWGADSVERVSDVRGTPGGSPQAVSAQAGNVTQLTINTTILTKRWQGYYGNITGKMTLSDASGYTLYDWSYDKDLSVTGEIYAANKSITSWANVLCVNLTGNGSIGSTDNATL